MEAFTPFASDFLNKPGFMEEGTGSIIGNLFSSFEIDSEDDLKLMEAIFQHIEHLLMSNFWNLKLIS